MKSDAIKKAILDIQSSVDEHGFTHKEFQTFVFEKTGTFISDSSVDRMLGKGNEIKGYNYKLTIEPALRALATLDPIDKKSNTYKLYEIELIYKDTEIEELTAKVEQLQEEREKEREAHQKQLDAVRAEYQKRLDTAQHQNDAYIEHLTSQIDIKDRRIDMRDERIDAKDEMIKSLQSQLNNCKDCCKHKE